MRVIGITGGVGAGKSKILDLLKQEYHARVIQADVVAKQLMEPGQIGYERLKVQFGTRFLTKEGLTDRKKLADSMFKDSEVLTTVNGIIHPLVWQQIQDEISKSAATLVVVEAALPVENPRDIYDELWYVYTSVDNRIQRLMESRGYTREKSLSMMANQPSEQAFRALADRVIDNNGSPEETKQQLEAIFKDKG
ncbi:MAG: dephospho-CoA kinase [Hungatella sp.]